MKEAIRQHAENALDLALKHGADELQQQIDKRLGTIVASVSESVRASVKDRFSGVKDGELLVYVPDKRKLGSVSMFLLALIALALLPAPLKLIALILFALGLFQFFVGYVNAAKVDIPDGWVGVICENGKPLENQLAKPGRNRFWSPTRFVPFMVSTRDQVVDITTVGSAGDFVNLGITNQIVFRVTDPAKFVTTTNPAGLMKILDLYASYTSLRIISSIKDSRVKFVGRDHLPNLIQALNECVSNTYGITVIRANMPSAENDVLDDLERVRTAASEVLSLERARQVRIENAEQAVESDMRARRKETRSAALELQQANLQVSTQVSEQVNARKSELVTDARRRLDEQVSLVRRELASLMARLEKAKVLTESVTALDATLRLRASKLKLKLQRQLIPLEIRVFDVDGLGTGVGMTIGGEMLRQLITKPVDPVAESQN